MKMLAEVSEIPFEDIETLPIGEPVESLKDLSEIESLPEDSKVKMKFKLGGKRWTVKWRQQELTGEQYIDTTHFCKDPDFSHDLLVIVNNFQVAQPYLYEFEQIQRSFRVYC